MVQVIIITWYFIGDKVNHDTYCPERRCPDCTGDISAPPISLDEHLRFVFFQENLVNLCTSQKVISACNEAFGRRDILTPY